MSERIPTYSLNVRASLDRRRWIAPVLSLGLGGVLIAGCGGLSGGSTSLPPETPRSGPHGGPMVPLPGGSGFGEVVIEYERNRAVVAAYFLNENDQPLDTLPTQVEARLETPSGELTVPLSPAPTTDKVRNINNSGKARFASKPGDYDLDRLIGTLSGTYNGQTFREAFYRSQ